MAKRQSISDDLVNLVDAVGAAGLSEQGLVSHFKPPVLNLAFDAIKDCSRRGEVVLDAFCGSGTTIMAAHKCGRKARAVELDPLYVDVAIRRWQAFTGEAATLAITGETFAEIADRRGDPLQ